VRHDQYQALRKTTIWIVSLLDFQGDDKKDLGYEAKGFVLLW